jgi:hypothetical protein
MHSFVQRLASSRTTLWGGLALLGALTLPLSSSFAQDYPGPGYEEYYDQPAYGEGYQAPARAPRVVVAPPTVVYVPEYRRPEWGGWRWRHWHRHHAPGFYHRYYRR